MRVSRVRGKQNPQPPSAGVLVLPLLYLEEGNEARTQAGLLAYGSSYSLLLPTSLAARQWFSTAFVPGSQWRDRARLARAFLFSPSAHRGRSTWVPLYSVFPGHLVLKLLLVSYLLALYCQEKNRDLWNIPLTFASSAQWTHSVGFEANQPLLRALGQTTAV